MGKSGLLSFYTGWERISRTSVDTEGNLSKEEINLILLLFRSYKKKYTLAVIHFWV